MRTRLPIMVAALLLISAGAKAQTENGQQDVPKQTPAASAVASEFGAVNQIDFGVRGTSFGAGSDQARFQRYQDLRDGATLDLFRYANNTDRYLVSLQADHVGYRDQRFSAAYNDYGKVKASFEWNQIPLNYSYTTQSLYTSSTPGVLSISDGIQSAIQNKALTLTSAVAGAPRFDLESKRNVADFRLTYSATKDVDLKFSVKNTQRTGAQPGTAGFGFSFATDEMPVPIDHRTTEFGSSLEWASGHAYAKAAYDGSFFRNNISSVTWDNPLRIADSATGGPAQGRLAAAPSTDANTLSVSGGFSQLPGRSSASAYVSVGNLSNNDTLIPFTSNTALAAPPLPRSTADVSARVTALNFNFTSRPTNMLWFSARYRQYGFDNRSTPFDSPASVGYDTSLAGAIESDQLGYTRHTFDADASFSPVTFVGIRAGYTREEIDRTFRFVEKTTEDTGRISADLTGLGFVTLRGVYEHSKRTGTAIDPAEILADGEQPGLTQFDIADRTRDRFSGIVIVTPVSMLSFNASVGAGKDDYPANGAAAVSSVYEHFGLLNNDSRTYQVGFDFVPVENRVTLGASYGYEKYTALQASRNAGHAATLPPAFFDPRDDWYDNSADKVHTANVSLDLIKLLPKVDLKVGYDYSKADSTYVYSLAPVTVLNTPNQLPAVTNELQRATVDGKYFLTRHVAVGLVYWYDKYSVNDFALGPQAGGLALPAANPSIMMLGYNYRPYNANTFMGRFTYLW